jgi:hypothetical protein
LMTFEALIFMASVLSLMASMFALTPKKVPFSVVAYFYVMASMNYLCHVFFSIASIIKIQSQRSCDERDSVLDFLTNGLHIIPLLIIMNVFNFSYYWKLKSCRT